MILCAGGMTTFQIVVLLTVGCVKLGGTQYLGNRNVPQRLINIPDVPFPPAQPTLENVDAICRYGNGRPRYPPSFFPRSGLSRLRRCGNAVNRLESWYSKCCSVEVAPELTLCCAQQAWKQALSQFCVEEYSTMTGAYECCREEGEAKWSCFNSELPNPFYYPTLDYTVPILPFEEGFLWNPTIC